MIVGTLAQYEKNTSRIGVSSLLLDYGYLHIKSVVESKTHSV